MSFEDAKPGDKFAVEIKVSFGRRGYQIVTCTRVTPGRIYVSDDMWYSKSDGRGARKSAPIQRVTDKIREAIALEHAHHTATLKVSKLEKMINSAWLRPNLTLEQYKRIVQLVDDIHSELDKKP